MAYSSRIMRIILSMDSPLRPSGKRQASVGSSGEHKEVLVGSSGEHQLKSSTSLPMRPPEEAHPGPGPHLPELTEEMKRNCKIIELPELTEEEKKIYEIIEAKEGTAMSTEDIISESNMQPGSLDVILKALIAKNLIKDIFDGMESDDDDEEDLKGYMAVKFAPPEEIEETGQFSSEGGFTDAFLDWLREFCLSIFAKHGCASAEMVLDEINKSDIIETAMNLDQVLWFLHCMFVEREICVAWTSETEGAFFRLVEP